MKGFLKIVIGSVLIGFISFHLGSCMHDPELITPDPVDTTNNGGGNTSGNPCDPKVVYFNDQILPLFLAGCAVSGCHDPIKKEEGVVLNSFENVMNTGGIKAFDPEGSKLYRMITASEVKDRMPPPPMNALTPEQKQLIYTWIQQDAKSLTCTSSQSCDTSNVGFSTRIKPIINTSCTVCHSGAAPSGGILLNNYEDIRTISLSGKLSCVINWNSGCVKMPKGGTKLEDCKISLIEYWIRHGSLNN